MKCNSKCSGECILAELPREDNLKSSIRNHRANKNPPKLRCLSKIIVEGTASSLRLRKISPIFPPFTWNFYTFLNYVQMTNDNNYSHCRMQIATIISWSCVRELYCVPTRSVLFLCNFMNPSSSSADAAADLPRSLVTKLSIRTYVG
ncbi:hypothetical protein QTP88_020014 [Uroleucon formosanum]